MFRRSPIAWTLTTLFVAITFVVLIVLAYVNNRFDERYLLDALCDAGQSNAAAVQPHFGEGLNAGGCENVVAIIDNLAAKRNVRLGVAALAIVVFGALGTRLLTGRLLQRPISALTTGMTKIARGDLDFRMNVSATDDFASVADSFNEMAFRLELLINRMRETRDYVQGIMENATDLIITVNPSGFIRTFNSGAETVLGCAKEEVVGRRFDELFADPDERDAATARLKTTDNLVNYETRLLTKNGEVREVILSLSRLRGPYGFPIGTIGIGKDLTTEKKLQRQLIQSERFAAVGQSFTALQHAMKNMLNAMEGGSYMVEAGIRNDDQKLITEGWEIVEEGISSISELSRNMLNYMKEWKPDFEWTSVAKIVDRIKSVVARTAADKGVEFQARTAPALPDVYCDANLIHAAVMDIVSNALEACQLKDYAVGESSRIDVNTAYDEASARLAIVISDNGPGMPDNVKNNIFTPFFSTKKNKGTGLGLAITARIVALHGGTIDVISEPGRGSTFRILLPVAGPEKKKGEP